MLTSVSAITLASHDMTRSVAFYRALGFDLKYGGPQASFTSFHAGSGYLNLTELSGQTLLTAGARSFTSMTSMRSMPPPWRQVCHPRSRRAMRPGASAISTSLIPTGTSSASRVRCEFALN